LQTLEGLRRKVEKAGDLRSVVHTMKMLASVGVRQHERAARALVDHGRVLELGFQALLRKAPEGCLAARHGRGRRPPRPAAIVLGSDQGMVGAFNERVAQRAVERLSKLARGSEIPVLAVGRRVLEPLARPFLRIEHALPAPGSVAGVPEILQDVLVHIEAWQDAGRFDALLVFHHKRGRGTASSPETRHVLPVPAGWLRALQRRPWPGRSLPAFSLDWERLYSALVREYVFLSLFRALVESLESEDASRLAATERAEKNVDERVEELEADLRQARQTAITSELLDVVSGFEAITGSG
jgi:F-type H+-transporting ATPase subunit gamma